MRRAPISEYIKQFKLVFWDFDGVIKDSVEVKTDAFMSLFQMASDSTLLKIREHHLVNGGMSRFEKIPKYLNWAGLAYDKKTVEEYCLNFANIVCQSVIESEWVPGVLDYLKENHSIQKFILVTGTPLLEIKFILRELNIEKYFSEVYGSPDKKGQSVKVVMDKYHFNKEESVFIGDSLEDYRAAKDNDISFVLRHRGDNLSLFDKYDGPIFQSLN